MSQYKLLFEHKGHRCCFLQSDKTLTRDAHLKFEKADGEDALGAPVWRALFEIQMLEVEGVWTINRNSGVPTAALQGPAVPDYINLIIRASNHLKHGPKTKAQRK